MTSPNMVAWSGIFTYNHIVPKRLVLPITHRGRLHCSLKVLPVVPFGLMMELLPTISWQLVIQRGMLRFFLPMFGIGTSYAVAMQPPVYHLQMISISPELFEPGYGQEQH